jgi:hypothetical protein
MGVDGARAIGVMLQRNGTLLNFTLSCKQPPFAYASSSLCLEFSTSMTTFTTITRVVVQTLSKLQKKKPSW